MSSAAQDAQFSCSRRSFLKGAAVVTATTAAGALLAACGSSDEVAQVAAAEIPVGGAYIMDRWIVSQPTEGQFVAFSRVCPHAQGDINKLGEFEGKKVAICAKHGSEFDITTGEVLSGPSRVGMSGAKSVAVKGDQVEITG
ncbi:Rieske 2Fe-2S domain-containing protein [Corynebacterium sp. 320]|uniref:Rieske 2Fe-2S domain-containing protein n=1 Tax=Corynebacterium zhongnanshanii TaxID=2768834 RepID=A0ABQ6VCG0_9CORY|nr:MULTISPECIES: Rieske 2Fe-2S domain-containing protein [Corynebacterium]KAB1503101.1 Rieske 2Fe-2S domain-containing protein [Corynebacterium sp. 320]KAB1551047.1 Rieske 2Fe-2S domain-containing protein [Corynebacterium sp. 319]KAB3519896.1 Rieske 2Fe-2S domain-containing protein [Corynebacterium zhongnanshanii]KAB3526898.1 Rieske 2Fe-2S domain-containing protein [Corynebacterium sp. 250]KAB3538391.1 Rieske 2Fe-2S domain-containing protein [Corynebacterium sp. 366]